MTKQQTKQIEMAKVYIKNGMTDTAARSVSALIRCAMTSKAKQEMLDFAKENNLTDNPEFIA